MENIKKKLSQNLQAMCIHQNSWMMGAAAIAAMRANRGHTLRDSVLHLLPQIVQMTYDDQFYDLAIQQNLPIATPFRVDRFVDSRFCREQVTWANPILERNGVMMAEVGRERWLTKEQLHEIAKAVADDPEHLSVITELLEMDLD
jgi:hypothetical protein